MRRRKIQLVQFGQLALPFMAGGLLFAQHGGPGIAAGPSQGTAAPPHSSPSASAAPRTYAPRSGTALWPYGAPGRVPGGVNDQHSPNHSVHPLSAGQPTEHRERFPYAYGGYTGLVPFGYGLPLAYGGNYIDQPIDQSVGAGTPEPAPPPPDNLANYPDSQGAPGSQVAANEDAPRFRPLYQGPVTFTPVQSQPATTLIFRDGRPPQLVHNYALTASTLYALDSDSSQEIPLSMLNVPATVDANRAAGVEFALPNVVK